MEGKADGDGEADSRHGESGINDVPADNISWLVSSNEFAEVNTIPLPPRLPPPADTEQVDQAALPNKAIEPPAPPPP